MKKEILRYLEMWLVITTVIISKFEGLWYLIPWVLSEVVLTILCIMTEKEQVK